MRTPVALVVLYHSIHAMLNAKREYCNFPRQRTVPLARSTRVGGEPHPLCS